MIEPFPLWPYQTVWREIIVSTLFIMLALGQSVVIPAESRMANGVVAILARVGAQPPIRISHVYSPQKMRRPLWNVQLYDRRHITYSAVLDESGALLRLTRARAYHGGSRNRPLVDPKFNKRLWQWKKAVGGDRNVRLDSAFSDEYKNGYAIFRLLRHGRPVLSQPAVGYLFTFSVPEMEFFELTVRDGVPALPNSQPKVSKAAAISVHSAPPKQPPLTQPGQPVINFKTVIRHFKLGPTELAYYVPSDKSEPRLIWSTLYHDFRDPAHKRPLGDVYMMVDAMTGKPIVGAVYW
jgi:hypothetical protein